MSGKRREYSADFKAKLVLQVLSGEKTASELCRTHKLHASVLNRWRAEFIEHASSIFERGQRGNEAEARVAELERLVGQITLELEIAKKASYYLSPDKSGRW